MTEKHSPPRSNNIDVRTLMDERGFLRCCQCGREGTQRFKVIPDAVHEPTGTVLGPFVVCESEKACRSRWSKPVFMGSE